MKKSLLHYNTFGIDAYADDIVEYNSEEQLLEWLKDNEDKLNILHVGEGSNLLFVGDFNGVVLHSSIKSIELLEEDNEKVLLRVGAGVNWDEWVAYAVDKKWYGIENLSLIPGEVGASAVQNIGAYGVEAKDVIYKVEGVFRDGTRCVFQNYECEYAYRKSIFKKKEMKSFFITYVQFCLSKKEKYSLEYGAIRRELEQYRVVDLRRVRDVIIKIREEKLPDPKVLGNAGSFFMNPIVEKSRFEELLLEYPNMPSYELEDGRVKIPAGWMIDKCGWKGKKMGNAGVYEKQALVLVNFGGASGKEIVDLSDTIRKTVFDKFGIHIYPEVNMIGV